jgi:hypothetical protein
MCASHSNHNKGKGRKDGAREHSNTRISDCFTKIDFFLSKICILGAGGGFLTIYIFFNNSFSSDRGANRSKSLPHR